MLFDESVLDEMLLSPHVLQMRSMYKINRRGGPNIGLEEIANAQHKD